MLRIQDKSLAVLSTVEELYEKFKRFGGIYRIDELSNGTFTILYKNGLQAQASKGRVGTLINVIGFEEISSVEIKFLPQYSSVEIKFLPQ